jgi:uncharacterized protein
MADLSAAEVIELLDLKPHPEGGHFRETFRDGLKISNTRAASSAIYFLLARGQRSCWHKIDAVEIWHYHAGAPLELQVALHDTGSTTRLTLEPDLMRGAPRSLSPRRLGSRLTVWATGCWSAARLRRHSSLPPLR